MTDAPQLGQRPDNAPTAARTIPRTVINHKLVTGYDLPPGEAEIEVIVHHLAFGRQSRSYRWAGPKSAPVTLPFHWEFRVDSADLTSALPWRLREVKTHDWGLYRTYVRTDGWLYPLAVWTDARLRLLQAMRWVSDRLILTLMVWGLAWVPQHEEPGWRHLGKKRTF